MRTERNSALDVFRLLVCSDLCPPRLPRLTWCAKCCDSSGPGCNVWRHRGGIDMKWIIVLVALTAWSDCSAQTVYKCKDKNGAPIFSQQPCASDPAKVETLEVKGIGKADPEAARAQKDSEDASFVSRSIDRKERECVENRVRPIQSSSNARVSGYQQRIDGLQIQTTRAKNNLAGATWESGIRSEIAALQTSISTERASADRLVSDAVAACAEERKRSEDRANLPAN
jgi:hypothetical protein